MLKLDVFDKADFSKLISWIDSEKLLIQFAGPIFSFPLTKQQLEYYISDPNRYAYKVISIHDNLTIGHGEIYLENNSAKLCRIIIGDQNFRGKGFGQKIVENLLEISFNSLAVEKVELNVFDWNSSAIKCYEKVGFEVNEGITTATNFHGKNWISLNMVITKIKWTELNINS